MFLIKVTALVAVASVVPYAAAHSWVEQMTVIDPESKQFTGTPGYARNATPRTTPGFSDPTMVHILPGQGQPSIEERDISIPASDVQGITQTDPMCKKTQQSQIQSSGLPRLSAAPGSMVALRYQENGHVTLPQNQPGKPPNRGTVYIYGTTQPKSNENFLDVFNKWNTAGTGGDKRGVLLATQPFDDGYCYQVNTGSISVDRQKQYPHTSNQLMGANLWCQNDIKIPANAPSGKPYTLYWVWDWPTAPGVDPNLPKGKSEIYTTCMDVDITAAKSKRDNVEARSPKPQASGNAALNNAAIPSYVALMAAAGTSAPAAAASAPPASSAPPAASIAPPAPSAPAASVAASTTVVAMNPSVAASIVEEALGPEISSLVAAKGASVTVTVTPSEKTVTVTANAEATAAVSSPASSAAPTISSPAPVATFVAVEPSAKPSSAAAMPPSSMDIQSPVLSAAAAPSATPASSMAAAAVAPASSLTLSAIFSGTAYPASAASSSAAATSAVPAPTASSVAKCKKAKRSRILGRAAVV